MKTKNKAKKTTTNKTIIFREQITNKISRKRDTVNPNGQILNSMKISKTLASPYVSKRLSLEANRVFGMITCMLVQAKKVWLGTSTHWKGSFYDQAPNYIWKMFILQRSTDCNLRGPETLGFYFLGQEHPTCYIPSSC